MKKIGVLFLTLLLALTIVSAQNQNQTEQTIEEKAYSCLKNKLGNNCGNGNVEQLAFSLLAMAYDSGIQKDCKSTLLDKQKTDNSFGSIKETSLAIIALHNIGADTTDEEEWLLSKKRNPSELEWYLEIDMTGQGTCTLSYDTASKTISISEDKKISGNLGNCFSLAYDNYWLKVKPECLNKNFTISCDRDFISTLIYKKSQSQVWYISSDVQSASAGGQTEHKISSYCFGVTSCDYEGSLWAVLALQSVGKDISEFIPYLVALSEYNEKYFPSSFLYISTNFEEYLNEILLSQSTQGYWDLGEKGKYYDTALALLALSSSESESLAKDWLENTQGNDGCWNNGNIRDTAFLLWAGWPKEAAIVTLPTENYCEDYNYYCITQGECDEAGGNVLPNFYCSGLKVCCDTPAVEKTCEELGGEVCGEDYICDEATVSALDTDECCLGSCISETPECEEYSNYYCRSECLEEEEETTLGCPIGKVCCRPKPKPEKSYWWIYILIILIILVVLGIIFRNKLRVLLFKFKGGFKKGPVTKTYPKFPPSAPPAGLRRMFPTRMPPRTAAGARVTTRPAARTKTDQELEETLKKLREMSK